MLPTGLKLRVPTMAAVAGLCVASYLLSLWTHTPGLSAPCRLRPPRMQHPAANPSCLEHTPCGGQPWSLQHTRECLAYQPGAALRCLVPAPAGYRVPPWWPQSRDAAWYVNAPHGELVAMKGAQNWVRREGDVLRFPSGGIMFPHGANTGSASIRALAGISETKRASIGLADDMVDQFLPDRIVATTFLLHLGPAQALGNGLHCSCVKLDGNEVKVLCPEVSRPGDVAEGEVKKWLERLTAPPPRITSGSLGGSITVEAFHKDAQLWRRRVHWYKSVNSGLAEKGRYRYRPRRVRGGAR